MYTSPVDTLQGARQTKSRAVAQSGSALAWGARGRGFESRLPDEIKRSVTDKTAAERFCFVFKFRDLNPRPLGSKPADGCKAGWTNTQCLPRRGEPPMGWRRINPACPMRNKKEKSGSLTTAALSFSAFYATNRVNPKDFTTNCIINTVLEPAPLFIRSMANWRGLKSFGARDFSPENSSDEGLKSLASTKTVARQTPIWRSILWDTCETYHTKQALAWQQ